jgi:hypothetical protein
MSDEAVENRNFTLRDHPEIATEIAVFIGNFNALESLLHLVFAQMLGDTLGATHAFLAPWNSFSQKLDIIRDVCRLFQDHPPKRM